MKTLCTLCPRRCELDRDQRGFCRARINRGGRIVSENYGRLTAIALDPIEKKPLYHFYPGNKILSVGSYGCNLRCPFCQNHDIAQVGEDAVPWRFVSPDELVGKAVELIPAGNIGIAYTYNEPLISAEYVLDCAKAARRYHLKNVLVTNGTASEATLETLLPWIDAMNIDLKGFSQEFYDKVGGDFETVRQTIRKARGRTHIELTKLVVPGMNDTEEDTEAMAKWIAALDPGIPLHVSRFFPRYRMSDLAPTPIATVRRMADVAKKYLKNVYVGNC